MYEASFLSADSRAQRRKVAVQALVNILHLIGVAYKLGHLLGNVHAVLIPARHLRELFHLPGGVLDGPPHGLLGALVPAVVRALQGEQLDEFIDAGASIVDPSNAQARLEQLQGYLA